MRVCIDTHIKQTFFWQLGSLNLVTISIPGSDNGIVITQNVLVLRRHKQKYSGVTCRDVWDSLSNSSAKMEEEKEGACQTDLDCSPTFPRRGGDTGQVIWPQSPLPAPRLTHGKPPALCLASCTTKIACVLSAFSVPGIFCMSGHLISHNPMR